MLVTFRSEEEGNGDQMDQDVSNDAFNLYEWFVDVHTDHRQLLLLLQLLYIDLSSGYGPDAQRSRIRDGEMAAR